MIQLFLRRPRPGQELPACAVGLINLRTRQLIPFPIVSGRPRHASTDLRRSRPTGSPPHLLPRRSPHQQSLASTPRAAAMVDSMSMATLVRRPDSISFQETVPTGCRPLHCFPGGVHQRRLVLVRERRRVLRTTSHHHWSAMSIRNNLLSGPLGFVTAPVGNMFPAIPDEEQKGGNRYRWPPQLGPPGRRRVPTTQCSFNAKA